MCTMCVNIQVSTYALSEKYDVIPKERLEVRLTIDWAWGNVCLISGMFLLRQNS